MNYTIRQLRQLTLSHSLFPPTSLTNAIHQLAFVQIDPIRSPAPAQDLILRLRVADYHVGDIDRKYISLGLEEDFLYAHGYMVPTLWQLLHPRNTIDLTQFDQKVLETVSTLKEIHPKDLKLYFEKKREINWWGGYSRSSKMSLDRLHYYGLLRVARRHKGIRIYQTFSSNHIEMSLEERLEKLIMTIVTIMAPVTSQTLTESLHRIHRHFGNTRMITNNLLETGRLEKQTIDGVTYLWPTGNLIEPEIAKTVTFLAPFDPVVRDRLRFKHLWGWPYQFEAYVPKAKRIRGYYAMPILWGEDMIGWANIKVVNHRLDVDLGFTASRPTSKQFNIELEREVVRLTDFLRLHPS